MSAAVQHVAMVWEDAPPHTWPSAYTGVCVKVTDGAAFTSRQGFSWAANYNTWVKLFGQERVGCWSVAYPQDGERLGQNIAHTAPEAPYVILDIEDFGGVQWTDQQIRAVVTGVKRAMPHALIGYSTYPTRAQATEHHVNQQLLEGLCDFAAPQVYYGYQRDKLQVVRKDHRNASYIVAPLDDTEWEISARASLMRSGRVFYWRMGLSGWSHWPDGLRTPSAPPPVHLPAADVMRPAVHTGGYPPRFVAWDGHGWYYTDLIWRRSLSEAQARGLHAGGVPVVLWPHCTAETQAVHPAP